MRLTIRQRARRAVGIGAAIGTSLQCSVCMILQLLDAYRVGPGALNFPMFATGGAAMLLWSVWALLKDDSVEWVAFVPNALGTFGSTAICLTILFYQPNDSAQAPSATIAEEQSSLSPQATTLANKERETLQ